MKKLSPQDKFLGTVFGFTAQDEAQLAEECRIAEAQEWAKARKLAEDMNADEWASAKGFWVPVLEEQVASAYCPTNGKVGSRCGDDFSMCEADLDYIEFGFIKPILTDKDVAHIKAEEALQAKRAAQRAAKRAQMLAGMGFANLMP